MRPTPELDLHQITRVFALAGRLALSSHHPVAAALARAAKAVAPLPGIEEQPGQGVYGMIDGCEVRLGRPSYCGAEAEADAVLSRNPEASVVAFRHGAACHVFAVRQRLRPDAAAVVEKLGEYGIGIEIVSGDRAPAVRMAAQSLNICEWRAEVTPVNKIARIEQLAQQGFKVLMIGDGLNDAPALAAAYASISPVTATHMSQAAADAVFLGERLAPVATAIAVSRKARALMRQNLWLAVIHNALAVPVAIAGLVTPLIAAAAMSGSSVLVMLNALRARLRAREMI